jgi:AraC family transcriptional activator of pobA
MTTSIPSYRLYREESGESGDFWIHSETIPERTHLHNWEIAQHRHDSFFQIFLLTAGEGEIVGEQQVRRFVAPCALFIPPGAVHGFRFSRQIDGLVVTALGDRLASIAAAERRIAGFVAQTRIVALHGEEIDASFAIDSVTRLHEELLGRAPGRMLLLEPLMTAAVVALARADRGVEAASETADDGGRIEALLTMIAAHFREHRPVAFYAAQLGLSPAHLNRVTRAATGFSVQALAARHVVEAARRDLVFTPTPIQAIAYSLGFADPAYFNRFFRRHAGVTPGAFRERERRRLAV